MGVFKKGVNRKLWAEAKAAVLKNKLLTEREKKFMAGFKDNLGPALDHFEDVVAAKTKGTKLDNARQAVANVLKIYGTRLENPSELDLNEQDAAHLRQHLGTIAGNVKEWYDKAK